MIAFGSPVAEPEGYRAYAEPGIRRAAEPDSEVYAFAAMATTARSYNLFLDTAAAREDLEALVLLHPHAEIVDPAFCQKARRALADPDVGVAGSVGATGVRSIAWWEGSVRSAPVTHRYHEHGGGSVSAYSWAQPEPAPGEVDTLDGFLLVLSPWVVRNVRFDEGLALGIGVDLDFCLRVRAAGRKVVTADLRATHHRSLKLVDHLGLWLEAHQKLAEKWDGRMPGAEAEENDWKQRARRAEAEREAARALEYSGTLVSDARVLALEKAIEEATGSLSWRVTAPLRRLNRWRATAMQEMRAGQG